MLTDRTLSLHLEMQMWGMEKLLVLALCVFVVNCSVAVIRVAESGYVVDFARTLHLYTSVFGTQELS